MNNTRQQHKFSNLWEQLSIGNAGSKKRFHFNRLRVLRKNPVVTAITGFILAFIAALVLNMNGIHGLNPLALSVVSSTPAAETNMSVGIQVSSLSDWTPAIPFKNLFKQSRPWYVVDANLKAGDWGRGGIQRNKENEAYFEKLKNNWLDEDGYPKEVPYTLEGYNDPETGKPMPLRVRTVMQADNSNYPAGIYTLKFEGTGKIVISQDGELEVEGRGGTTTAEFNVTPKRGIALDLMESNASDPVRNIQVILPGYENDDLTQAPFNPLYVERLKEFSPLRFFGNATKPVFANALPQKIVAWADRIQPNEVRYPDGGKGGWGEGWPLEYMAELCNEVGADLWWSTGYAISDEYIRNAAELLKERLAPNRKIYLEYSNEIWNGRFPQFRYVTEAGVAQGLGETLNKQGNKEISEKLARIDLTVKRSLEIFQIFREVFGSDERLVEVIPGWNGAPDYNEKLLAALDNPKVNAGKLQPDALAIAPYWGIPKEDLEKLSSLTVDSVIEIAENYFKKDDNERYNRVLENVSIAKSRGLDILAYESGQHFAAPQDSKRADVFVKVNRDPRIYELYLLYFGRMNAWGFKTVSQFNYVGGFGKYGSWGALEYLNQPLEEAHKYRALLKLNEQLELTPTGVTVTRSDNSVEINWQGVEAATSYQVYRHTVNNPSNATSIATVPAQTTTFTDKAAKPATNYYYWVKAYKGSDESTYSVGQQV